MPVQRNASGVRRTVIALGICAMAAVAVAAPVVLQEASDETESLITNGTFTEWSGDGPKGWFIEVGARNGGDEPVSEVERGEDSSLRLSGDARTLSWNAVRQPVSLNPGGAYRLQFAARGRELRREASQYDNCYVGVFFKDAQGKNVGQQFASIQQEAWLPYALYFRVPNGVASANVTVFLSKSGALEVKELSLAPLAAADSFDVLVDEMDRSYSQFELRQIDWPRLAAKYRDQALAADSPKTFAEVVATMLAELEDMHCFVVVEGKQVSKFRSSATANFDFDVVDGDLAQKKAIGKWSVVGRTPEGLGYVRIMSLLNIDPQELATLIAEIEALFDAPGLIVDLRQNIGGSEPMAQEIASLFADGTYVYARQQVRSGPGHGDLVETTPRQIAPRLGATAYTRRIACLTGPGAVSSAEGFALMMKALPHCALIGQPTRGASGNPAAISLPNGVDVYFSRWISLEADGTPIEGRGVQPDLEIKHKRGADPTYAHAKKWLTTAGD